MSGIAVAEIAREFGRSPYTLRRILRKGTIPHTRNDLGHMIVDHEHVPTLVAAAPRIGTSPFASRPAPAPPRSDLTWMDNGACADLELGVVLFYGGEDEDLWGTKRARETAAKVVCATCPVITTCREYALARREEWGIWGGLTATERRKILAPKTDTKAA